MPHLGVVPHRSLLTSRTSRTLLSIHCFGWKNCQRMSARVKGAGYGARPSLPLPPSPSPQTWRRVPSAVR
jgi:hypothetical protein